MGSKSKRKSVNSERADSTKKSGTSHSKLDTRNPLAWEGLGMSATLTEGQMLVFLGRGQLTVSSGMVVVQGKTCKPGDPAVQLCADERAGGALLIEPIATHLQVPRAAGSAEVALHIASWPPAPGPVCGGEEAAGKLPSFSVHLSTDPQAPSILHFGDVWLQAVHDVLHSLPQLPPGVPPVIVVMGPKKVGKSTFARHLANALLNTYLEVAFMDTDCGQTEFTPPGLLSLSMLTHPLLGPPHLRLHPPTLSYFMGDLSPACDPLLYLRYVREMYRWYLRRVAARPPPAAGTSPLPPPPLVVNTHGWVKGLGLDLLMEMLQSLHPITHCVQLCSPNPHKNQPEGVFWAAPDVLTPAPVLMWRLPALGAAVGAEAQPSLSGVSQSSGKGGGGGGEFLGAGGGSRALPPVELRALQWTAFAQQCVAAMGGGGSGGGDSPAAGGTSSSQPAQGGATSAGAGAEVADMLAALAPYEVRLEDVEVQVLHSPIPPSQILHATNCAVVGLCTPPPQPPPGAAAAAADPPCPPCVGVGLVRGVDPRRGVLYVLTPLEEGTLEEVSILQLGKLELPNSLLQSPSFLSPYLCLFSIPSMGTGAGVIKSRNNLARQSQL